MRNFFAVILIGAALLMSGCSNKSLESKESGFLKSYEGLDDEETFVGAKSRIMPGTDFSKYDSILVEPIQVLSGIAKSEQTLEQKKLFKQISEYLTEGYKKVIREQNQYYTLAEVAGPKTLKFEVAVSAVEVNHDDIEWYQLSPITMGLTLAARATYKNAAVRILAEGRLSESDTGKVLARTVRLEKGVEVSSDADELQFEDVKPSLDSWLKGTKENLARMHKGLIKYQEDRY